MLPAVGAAGEARGGRGFARGTPPLEVHQWGQTLGASSGTYENANLGMMTIKDDEQEVLNIPIKLVVE